MSKTIYYLAVYAEKKKKKEGIRTMNTSNSIKFKADDDGHQPTCSLYPSVILSSRILEKCLKNTKKKKKCISYNVCVGKGGRATTANRLEHFSFFH